MLTQKDIKNLTEYQKEVFKDIFFTKEEGKLLEKKVDNIQIAVDNMAKDIRDIKDDNMILNHRMKNAEGWIDQASPKLDIKFEH